MPKQSWFLAVFLLLLFFLACYFSVSSASPGSSYTLAATNASSPSFLPREASATTPTTPSDTATPPANFFDGCRHVYIDAGSNIGVQVRKLFEPELYQGAPVLGVFDRAFGPDRKNANVCAVGFEGNPSHAARLKMLETCYNRKGWRVKFFCPGAVMDKDGNMSFFSDNAFNAEEWAASIFNHAGTTGVTVPTYDLSQFILSKITPRKIPDGPLRPYVLMKLDIEGGEMYVLPRMMEQGSLCARHVNEAFIEWHERYITPAEKRGEFQAVHQATLQFMREKKTCEPTLVNDLDDETFLHDGQPFPAICSDIK